MFRFVRRTFETDTTSETFMRHLFVLFSFLTAGTVSWANDGWAVYLGGEKSVSPHPQIRMVKEYITIDVGDRSAWVTCTFWFRNEGPATVVQMAYPDESSSTWGGLPFSQLHDFRSWVNGTPIETKFQLIKNQAYRVKQVQFGARSNRKVVNRYRIPLGSVATKGQVYVHDLHYTFSTGACWKGNIGRTELITRFKGKFKPRNVQSEVLLEREGPSSFWKNHSSSLFANGPRGDLNENRYRIVRRNWRPTEGDNLRLQSRPFTIDWSRGEHKTYLGRS